MAAGRLLWVDLRSGHRQVMEGAIPALQPVFHNQNMVAVTEGMVANQGDAFSILTLWHEEVGVSEVTRYTSLLPTPVADTVTWDGGAPVGNNFTLEAGRFLWVKFNHIKILDLGQNLRRFAVRNNEQPLDTRAPLLL